MYLVCCNVCARAKIINYLALRSLMVLLNTMCDCVWEHTFFKDCQSPTHINIAYTLNTSHFFHSRLRYIDILSTLFYLGCPLVQFSTAPHSHLFFWSFSRMLSHYFHFPLLIPPDPFSHTLKLLQPLSSQFSLEFLYNTSLCYFLTCRSSYLTTHKSHHSAVTSLQNHFLFSVLAPMSLLHTDSQASSWPKSTNTCTYAGCQVTNELSTTIYIREINST